METKRITAAAMFGCAIVLANQAHAGNGAFDFLDPCIAATDDFRKQSARIMQVHNSNIANVMHAKVPTEYRKAWLAHWRKHLRTGYFAKNVAPTLKRMGVKDMNKAYRVWFEDKIKQVGEKRLATLIRGNFRRELLEHRRQTKAQSVKVLNAQKKELDQACKPDVGNQVLRATVTILAAPFNIVGKNLKGAKRESGVGAKVLKAITGGSVKDMKKHGIFGGPNSIFRKPFG